MLPNAFFNHDASEVAKKLLGKVLRVNNTEEDTHGWLSAQIIETEAYYLSDKASHASLGYTPKRKALFMPPGTIYMYYARGKDSLNVSTAGKGNAVLIKSAYPYIDDLCPKEMIALMRAKHQALTSGKPRPIRKLCAGQTLLCTSLGLKVTDWDQKQFNKTRFFIEDIGYQPSRIIQTTRLGIPCHRDADLPLRFIDASFVAFCTKNPLLIKET